SRTPPPAGPTSTPSSFAVISLDAAGTSSTGSELLQPTTAHVAAIATRLPCKKEKGPRIVVRRLTPALRGLGARNEIAGSDLAELRRQGRRRKPTGRVVGCPPSDGTPFASPLDEHADPALGPSHARARHRRPGFPLLAERDA